MQRFYLNTDILGINEFILKDEEIIYQLSKVLRAKKGEKIIFFDGINLTDFIYEINLIEKKSIILNFVSKINKENIKKDLNLYQALPNKLDKIEEIIQKGTEIGYNNFYFYKSNRSQNIQLSPNKLVRLEKIIKEATEQSNRNTIPKIIFLTKLDLINIIGENIFFHTNLDNSKKLSELSLNFTKKINIFVGPEGGFDEKENEIFLKNKFIKINLGNNILRTENTPIVVGFYILNK
ncbi:16S rRNA (uracil(1498)-N(3))-methyltransferase [Candidatus Gracilibacteria bacterium]|nr:16S rRNA (uracil(1498)-N(3))-methyltransferase [Candidatus Gracilibacteria bacterium]